MSDADLCIFRQRCSFKSWNVNATSRSSDAKKRKEISSLKVSDCDNSKRSSSSVLIKSRAKKSPFVKYHVSQRMPDSRIMNSCDVSEVSLSVFIWFVFTGRSEARLSLQDPISLLSHTTFLLEIGMRVKRWPLTFKIHNLYLISLIHN